MQRREFIAMSVGGAALAMVGNRALASAARLDGAEGGSVQLPRRRRIRVAFLIGEHANVIDTAGPWEVFQDTMLANHQHPFRLYTVAPTRELVTMTGGLKVQPHHTIDNAPQPHVIVVPAHRATDASRAWLRKASANTDVTLSVCTGAFQLARAGLLEGLAATTHHQFWDAFAEEFPDIELRRGLRFVDSGRIATAGGLTSGIDMALHIVQRYFGEAVAEATARYMEHDSEAWRTG
jgi:transcriptional regulator GlxA family with amidase domain